MSSMAETGGPRSEMTPQEGFFKSGQTPPEFQGNQSAETHHPINSKPGLFSRISRPIARFRAMPKPAETLISKSEADLPEDPSKRRFLQMAGVLGAGVGLNAFISACAGGEKAGANSETKSATATGPDAPKTIDTPKVPNPLKDPEPTPEVF